VLLLHRDFARPQFCRLCSVIAYRKQNGGDYLILSMQLRRGLGDPDAIGFALHVEVTNGLAASEEKRSRRMIG
jgi:hypothetical protein